MIGMLPICIIPPGTQQAVTIVDALYQLLACSKRANMGHTTEAQRTEAQRMWELLLDCRQ